MPLTFEIHSITISMSCFSKKMGNGTGYARPFFKIFGGLIVSYKSNYSATKRSRITNLNIMHLKNQK